MSWHVPFLWRGKLVFLCQGKIGFLLVVGNQISWPETLCKFSNFGKLINVMPKIFRESFQAFCIAKFRRLSVIIITCCHSLYRTTCSPSNDLFYNWLHGFCLTDFHENSVTKTCLSFFLIFFRSGPLILALSVCYALMYQDNAIWNLIFLIIGSKFEMLFFSLSLLSFWWLTHNKFYQLTASNVVRFLLLYQA